jgi:hypothetical protein
MKKVKWLTPLVGLTTLVVLSGCNQSPAPQEREAPSTPVTAPAMLRQPAPNGAEVYFIAPENGATLSNPIVVQFGLRNMGIAPAGANQPNTGHHHLLVDAQLAQMGFPVPADDQHLHFGGGQTQTNVTLAPGEHSLQLVLGDYLHIPHDPPVTSARITITVTE